MAGIALCAFFVLGVITGLSQSGRIFALRLEALLNLLPRQGRSALIPADFPHRTGKDIPLHQAMTGAIALVEQSDGFYTLDAQGELRGPIPPASAGDLAILSGPGVENARAARLVEYAGMLVRAEADLSALISEMHVDNDGGAVLFLDRPRLEIAVALGDLPLELAHANRVLTLWRGHRELIAAIDMTTPGQAVVRLKPSAIEAARRGTEARGGAMVTPARFRGRRNLPPEVTATR